MHTHAVAVLHRIVHGPVKGQPRHKGNDTGNGKNRHGFLVPAGKELTADRKGYGSSKVTEHGTDAKTAEENDVDAKTHSADKARFIEAVFRTVEDLAKSHGSEKGADGLDDDGQDDVHGSPP